jgi:hypothetical protein
MPAIANSVSIVGIIRIIYTKNLYFNTYDTTWASEPIWTWTAVEVHGAIICASAPALKVFFKRYLSVGTSRNGYGNNRGPGYHVGAKLGYGEGAKPTKTEKALNFGGISYDSETGIEGSTWANSGSVVEYETTAFGEKTQVKEWDQNINIVSAG